MAEFEPLIPAIAARLPAAAVQALEQSSAILYIEDDPVASALGHSEPSSSEYANAWGVDHVEADLVHENTGMNGGDGIKVAVIDTGVDYNHPDLAPVYKGGYDFVNRDSNPLDDNNHGTHVSGTLAAVRDGSGVVGVAPSVDLYALKVLGRDGRGSYSNIISALNWAVNNDMDIVSMSLGGSSSSITLADAVENAYQKGLLLVAAAGNNGGTSISYPARYDSVIAVGATDKSDNKASFSNYGSRLELVAPGVSIKSTVRNGGYATFSGTSMATPHVSGVAALVWSNGIATTNDGVRERLQETALDLGGSGKDSIYGYGLVLADKAVGTPPPLEEDTTPPSQVTGLAVATRGSSQLDLSWDASTAEDLAHYKIYRSTQSGFAVGTTYLVGQSGTHSFSDSGLAASTTYYYRVAAVDESGNAGIPSEEASGTTDLSPPPADTTSPSLTIITPDDGSALPAGAIGVAGIAEDHGSGIKTVEVRVDGGGYATATPKAPGDWSEWTISINVNGAGTHEIQARATDNSGNQALHSISVTTVIEEEEQNDVTNPSVTITSPSLIVSRGTVTVQGIASDNPGGSGVMTVEVRINSDPYVTATPKSPGDWSEWSISIDIDSGGLYRIYARATDNAGNQELDSVTIYAR